MAIAGVGAQLLRSVTEDSSGDDSSGGTVTTYAAIGEINSIDGPNMSRETIDTTALDTSGGYRTFIPSFRDAGEITLEMNFTVDTYDDMLLDFEASSIRYYHIVFPDTTSTTLEFAGYVTALGTSIPTDDKVTASVTIKISGVVTLSS